MKSFIAVVLGLVVTCSVAFAQEDPPEALIKKVTEDVLTIVRQDKDIQNGNSKKAIELVEAKVLPNFNFQRMTALADRGYFNAPESLDRLQGSDRTLQADQNAKR